jgi:hypothetical protein
MLLWILNHEQLEKLPHELFSNFFVILTQELCQKKDENLEIYDISYFQPVINTAVGAASS